MFTASGVTALASVLGADLVLAGDNAIVVGVAAAGLSERLRRRAVIFGIVIATVLRIGFSWIALDLLAIIGLTLAGGVLLLWVAWKLWRELKRAESAAGRAATTAPAKTMGQALRQIVLADVSMSLDNVLAVAGAARGDAMILAIGLVISVALTGLASAVLARILTRHRWVSYLGLAMVAFIACRMIWDGASEVARAVPA